MFALPEIILASASPRRSELLNQIGVRHRIHPVDVDESVQPGEAPALYVTRLALTKARAGWQRFGQAEALAVLGSDTAVVLGPSILGKPRDQADAVAMLMQLSGQTHEVLTSVALVWAGEARTRTSVTRVRFAELTEAECLAYWHTGEPADKAGAYAIQGLAARFIERIDGSYSGVMGLPLFETSALLRELEGATEAVV